MRLFDFTRSEAKIASVKIVRFGPTFFTDIVFLWAGDHWGCRIIGAPADGEIEQFRKGFEARRKALL